MKNRKQWMFKVISVAFGTLITLGGLEIVMRFLPVSGIYPALPVNASAPVMHYPPHYEHQYSTRWNFAIAQIKHSNNDGYYSDYDYVKTTKPVMAIIGDSFIEAEQIPNKDAVHDVLHREVGDQGRVYGFGIQGAPLSQYLTFAQHARDEFKPSAMTFTIIGNDFDQSLMQYGGSFLEGMTLFTDTSDHAKLKLIDYRGSARSGLAGFFKKMALFRYIYSNVGLNPHNLGAQLKQYEKPPVRYGGVDADYTPQRLDDSKRAVELFFKYLPEKTGLPPDKILFVIDGMREANTAKLMQDAEQSYFGQMRPYFMQAARSRGYEVVDMNPIFFAAQSAGKKVDFIPIDWHWNAVGHRLVADQIKGSRVYQQAFPPNTPITGQ